MFFKKATKIEKIFTVDLTLCSKCQIDGEDFVKFLENTIFKSGNFDIVFTTFFFVARKLE
jgi:hypothetical protein